MSKEELKRKLSPEAYKVTQEGATEAPFSGKYVNNREKGMYKCAVCGAELFSSDAKFDSGTGWPSFTEPANLKQVELKEDLSHNMRLPASARVQRSDGRQAGRAEVVCKNCGAHLGHIFPDGPQEAGGKRYCINSCALDFNSGTRKQR